MLITIRPLEYQSPTVWQQGSGGHWKGLNGQWVGEVTLQDGTTFEIGVPEGPGNLRRAVIKQVNQITYPPPDWMVDALLKYVQKRK